MAKKQTLKTGNPAAAKPGKARIEVALPDALEEIASRVAGAIGESLSLSETLGDLTREAAPQLVGDTVVPFVDACAQLCDAAGLTTGSVKVYLSNMRGVLRAMVAGWNPPADVETLRAMYGAIPDEFRGSGANRGNTTKRGARTATAKDEGQDDGEASPAQAATANPKLIDKEAAIRRLFGHFDDRLADAMEYAMAHESMFVRWAEASAKAAQQVPQLKAA